MKKKILFTVLFCGISSIAAFAQYKPTEKNLGNDCTTENGKIGTWKSVTITEKYENTNSRGNANSNSNTGTVGVSTNASVGTKTNNVNVGANASYQNSNTNTSSNSRSQSTSTTRTYQDIQCIEDKNANLPQRTPIRW